MSKIAILIPCYNEELTIKKVIDDCHQYLPDATVYVYDNNSTDKTAEIAKNSGAVVRHEYQQGKGNVVRRMFREIEADCYLMVDGDDTYDLSNAREMVDEVLEHNVDMVIGDRLSSTYFTENKRRFHNAGNSFVRSSINHLFKGNIRDVMTGYRAFSYLYVKSFPILSTGFEIETEMTIHALENKLSLKNIIINYRDRPAGSFSKLNTISDGIKVIKTISKMFKNNRPSAFFSIIALILFVISLALIIPGAILLTKVNFSSVLAISTILSLSLISVGFIFVIACIVSIFSGTILSSIKRKERKEFELHLNDLEIARNNSNKND